MSKVIRIVGNRPQVTVINPTTIKIAMGIRGPRGEDGVSGGLYYEHTQSLAASLWTINHNLGGYPSVTTVDLNGELIFGDVDYISQNQITVTYSVIVSGKAYLS